jgi:Ca-activated chloride channel family protein
MKHPEEKRDEKIRELFSAARKIDRAWAPDFHELMDREPEMERRRIRFAPLLAIAASFAVVVSASVWLLQLEPAPEPVLISEAQTEPPRTIVESPPVEFAPAPGTIEVQPEPEIEPEPQPVSPAPVPQSEGNEPPPPPPPPMAKPKPAAASGPRSSYRPRSTATAVKGGLVPLRDPPPSSPDVQKKAKVIAAAESSDRRQERRAFGRTVAGRSRSSVDAQNQAMRFYQNALASGNANEAKKLLQAIVQAQRAGKSFSITDAPDFSTEKYDPITENGFRTALSAPLSTFSIDVDTASYSNVRRFLRTGRPPPVDAVRIEELINYFDYDYPQPTRGDEPFAVDVEVAGCPWNPAHRLARIGLKGREVSRLEGPGSNLVFLIDVSGSMNDPDKLPLLKSAMAMLVGQLDSSDRVGIVVFAAGSSVLLPSTSGARQREILDVIEDMAATGSTNGGAGLSNAYTMARRNFVRGGINRVILATDGDFNVGVTTRNELLELIREEGQKGTQLTALGFGGGNLQDSTLEMLTGRADGNYFYIDSLAEAQRVLVDQSGGTLITIAEDVKIQVEFNPAEVGAYRLIGYENRKLRKEDFNDDTKDAGEIGSGHTVTALYELLPPDRLETLPGVDPLKYREALGLSDAANSGEAFTVKLRYKKPGRSDSRLITLPVYDDGYSFAAASEDFKFASAVAEFGMLLRDSEQAPGASLEQVREIGLAGRGSDEQGYRDEFLDLVERAMQIFPDRAAGP